MYAMAPHIHIGNGELGSNRKYATLTNCVQIGTWGSQPVTLAMCLVMTFVGHTRMR